MAMEWPHTGIVGDEVEDDIRHSRLGGDPSFDHLGVSPLWVMRPCHGPVPLTRALGDNPEVVSVEVHGVSEGNQSSDDQPHRGVALEVVHVPLRVIGIGSIPQLRKEKNGITVIPLAHVATQTSTTCVYSLIIRPE